MNMRLLPLVGVVAVLVGCGGGREVSRIQVSGLYDDADLHGPLPADADEIYRIPVGGRKISADAPVVDGDLLVIVNRLEVYRRTGAVLPAQEAGLLRSHPDRQINNLADEISQITRGISALGQTVAAIKVNGSAEQVGHLRHDFKPLFDAISEACLALEDEQRSTRRPIPVHQVPAARWDELMGQSAILAHELATIARVFGETGAVGKIDRAAPGQRGTGPSFPLNDHWRAWQGSVQTELESLHHGFQKRDQVAVAGAVSRVRIAIRRLDQDACWDALLNRSDTVLLRAPLTDDDLTVSLSGYRHLEIRATALWAEVLGSVLRLAPEQPLPVLVYQDGAR